jgi:hypothetical protein
VNKKNQEVSSQVIGLAAIPHLSIGYKEEEEVL